MSKAKDKIAAWQVKLKALSATYDVSLRAIEYILKKNFEELDWRSLLTDEMIDFADKELARRKTEIKHKGKDKYEAQKKYFKTEKGRRKVIEAVQRNRINNGRSPNRMRNAERKSDN